MTDEETRVEENEPDEEVQPEEEAPPEEVVAPEPPEPVVAPPPPPPPEPEVVEPREQAAILGELLDLRSELEPYLQEDKTYWARPRLRNDLIPIVERIGRVLDEILSLG